MTGFFRLRRGALSAKAVYPMILLILSNFLLKTRIHSIFVVFLSSLFKVSFSIRLAVFSGQRRCACETSFQKLELALSWATLHFVGWVEPTPDFVGFRCTQPNLHFAGVIANCETQQRPISEPSPKCFFFRSDWPLLKSAAGPPP